MTLSWLENVKTSRQKILLKHSRDATIETENLLMSRLKYPILSPQTRLENDLMST